MQAYLAVKGAIWLGGSLFTYMGIQWIEDVSEESTKKVIGEVSRQLREKNMHSMANFVQHLLLVNTSSLWKQGKMRELHEIYAQFPVPSIMPSLSIEEGASLYPIYAVIREVKNMVEGDFDVHSYMGLKDNFFSALVRQMLYNNTFVRTSNNISVALIESDKMEEGLSVLMAMMAYDSKGLYRGLFSKKYILSSPPPSNQMNALTLFNDLEQYNRSLVTQGFFHDLVHKSMVVALRQYDSTVHGINLHQPESLFQHFSMPLIWNNFTAMFAYSMMNFMYNSESPFYEEDYYAKVVDATQEYYDQFGGQNVTFPFIYSSSCHCLKFNEDLREVQLEPTLVETIFYTSYVKLNDAFRSSPLNTPWWEIVHFLHPIANFYLAVELTTAACFKAHGIFPVLDRLYERVGQFSFNREDLERILESYDNSTLQQLIQVEEEDDVGAEITDFLFSVGQNIISPMQKAIEKIQNSLPSIPTKEELMKKLNMTAEELEIQREEERLTEEKRANEEFPITYYLRQIQFYVGTTILSSLFLYMLFYLYALMPPPSSSERQRQRVSNKREREE